VTGVQTCALPIFTLGERLFQLGRERPSWYKGTPEAMKQQFGSEDNLLSIWNAILSQSASPKSQTLNAYAALRRLYEFGPKGLEERLPGYVSNAQMAELRKAYRAWKKDPTADLSNVLSAGSVKRRDYYHSLRGRTDLPVIDRHIGDIYYGEGVMGASGPRYIALYKDASLASIKLADLNQVTPAHYQGSQWQAYRLIKYLMTRQNKYLEGNNPYAEQLIELGRQSPDWQWLKAQGYEQKVGATHLPVLLATLGLTKMLLQQGAAAPEAPPPQ